MAGSVGANIDILFHSAKDFKEKVMHLKILFVLLLLDYCNPSITATKDVSFLGDRWIAHAEPSNGEAILTA